MTNLWGFYLNKKSRELFARTAEKFEKFLYKCLEKFIEEFLEECLTQFLGEFENKFEPIPAINRKYHEGIHMKIAGEITKNNPIQALFVEFL